MKVQHVHRSWYRVVDYEESVSVGAFSTQFPDNTHRGWQVIAVDWSTPGEVQVTWLVPGPEPGGS